MKILLILNLIPSIGFMISSAVALVILFLLIFAAIKFVINVIHSNEEDNGEKEKSFKDDCEEYFKVNMHPTWGFLKEVLLKFIEKYEENYLLMNYKIELSEHQINQFNLNYHHSMHMFQFILEEIGIKTKRLHLDDNTLKITMPIENPSSTDCLKFIEGRWGD
jgi:uncharacterized protein YpmS